MTSPFFTPHVQFSTYDHRVNKMNHECVVMIQQMTQIKDYHVLRNDMN